VIGLPLDVTLPRIEGIRWRYCTRWDEGPAAFWECACCDWEFACPMTGRVVKPACDHLSCGENVTFLARKALFSVARVPVSIAGFGPCRLSNFTDAASSIWHSARFGPRPRPGRTGRFYALKIAPCTICCRKKNVENQLGYGYRLAATTWLRCGPDPRATFVAACSDRNRRMRFCSRRGGIPEA
jgi:hypothetical protein